MHVLFIFFSLLKITIINNNKTCTTHQNFSTEHTWHIFFLESTLHKNINKIETIFFCALYDLLHIYQENNNFID
jgi:hypothetical protein